MTSAWTGDWYKRVKERVYERGFHTVTAFADSQPTASLLELADELGKDVAASQVEKVLVDEAEATGDIERCARSLLARRLKEKFPDGWPAEWNRDARFRRASAYSAWAVALGKRYEQCWRSVGEALKAAALDATLIPAGWLPAGPDDPILVKLFQQHWDNK